MISSRDLGIFRRLLRHARPCWPHLAAIFLLQLIAAPIALLGPVTLKIAADNAIGQQPLPWYLAWMAPDGFSPLAGVGLQDPAGDALNMREQGDAQCEDGHHEQRGTADTVYRIQ